MIYLDNAATTINKPTPVYDAVLYAMQHTGNPGRGTSDTAMEAARDIYAARVSLCGFFGGDDPARIVFTSNATEALNIAIHGLIGAGDHVITTQLEHNSVLRPLYMRRDAGADIEIVPCRENGMADVDAMIAAIRPDTKAIVCTHASNLTGNVTDIAALGQAARDRGILFIVDASQTAGILPINVKAMNIDVLCFTGHKSMLGPQGTGGMYVGERADIRPFKSGGTGVQSFLEHQPDALPQRLEAGTLNGPGIAGLKAATEHIMSIGLGDIYEKEHSLQQLFLEQIREIPRIRIYGDFTPEQVRCPIVSLNIGDVDSTQIGSWLQEDYGIAVRTGAHCAPLMHQYFGTRAQGMVRFSFSYYNTVDEINVAADALGEIAESVGFCGRE